MLFFTKCKNNEPTDVNWPRYLGDSEMSHFSTISQITKKNIDELEVAWKYNTSDSGDFQCNPLIIDGILYGISAASNVFALNAVSGEEIWRFTPSKTKYYLKNRGVSFWENREEKRVFCSYDEWLYALDANTGEPIQSFGINGRVTLRSGLGSNADGKYLMSRTPGTVFENLIIMPTVMMEGPGAAPGFLQAFNVRTGELEWVFNTIPLPGEYGFDTWPEDVHEKGIVGGANNWTGISLDEKRGIIFVPTGSAGPDFFGGSRKGKNLFANTLLAIDASSGKRLWHYKIVSHDIWDRDLPAPTNLTTIKKGGKLIDVAAQITKTGHVFVFDRETGEPIYPIEEIAVPPSPLKEEAAWPTQIFPKVPLPFTRQELIESDLNIFSPDYDSLLTVFNSSKKGIYHPFSDKPTLINPGLNGGGEWGGAAVDKEGVLYVNANEVPWIVKLKQNEVDSNKNFGELVYMNSCSTCHGVERKGNSSSGFPSLISLKDRFGKKELYDIIDKGKGMMPGFPQFSFDEKNALVNFLFNESDNKLNDIKSRKNDFDIAEPWGLEGYSKFLDSEGNSGLKPPWGTLTAIDLNTGKHKWQVPLGENQKYKQKYGVSSGSENYGGPIVTASGIVFIAAASDSKIRAFDKETGDLLWEDALPASGFATPSTYMVDGIQYVVIACGGTKLGLSKGDFLIAYKLSKL